jgi:hypothetical protein
LGGPTRRDSKGQAKAGKPRGSRQARSEAGTSGGEQAGGQRDLQPSSASQGFTERGDLLSGEEFSILGQGAVVVHWERMLDMVCPPLTSGSPLVNGL